MKCIHCESDTKLKDRKSNGGRCAQCLHRFAFEPTTDPRKVTDGLFLRCIKDVSGDDTLFFTEKQLWYEFNRRLLRKIVSIPPPFSIGAGICAAGGFVGMVAGVAFLLPAGLVAGAAALIIGAQVGKKNPKPRRVIIPLEDFRSRYLQTYRGTHGRIEKLLPEIKLLSKARETADMAATPPDLASYSFDRALVTQDAETAAMLVANRFHFENNCAIVSQDRLYPDNGRFEMILEMLKQNPALTVFTIHDASVTGTLLPVALRNEDWFPNHTVRIADLGLRPLHVQKGGFVLNYGKTQQPSPEVASRLSPEETTWLAQGNVAEIAALRPARLMRAIYQGFNRVNAMPAGPGDSGADGVIIVGGPHYGGDVWVDSGTGADVFAADSFG